MYNYSYGLQNKRGGFFVSPPFADDKKPAILVLLKFDNLPGFYQFIVTFSPFMSAVV